MIAVVVVASAGATTTAATTAGAGTRPPDAAAATPLETDGCDFDGDRFDDQAIGVPGESIGGVPDVGAVQVLYGSVAGLATPGNQLWHQDIAGVVGANEAGDRLGEAIACGDFDNDGFDDLAAGAPSEGASGRSDAGAVTVLFGSASGLTAAGNQQWTQDSTGTDSTESRERFGASLAAGDFDGNGFDDLAIGVPAEKVGSTNDDKLEGAASVLYGSPAGLATPRAQLWHQDSPGILGTAEPRDLFATSLTSGDFDGDGFDDLAVGVPAENIGDIGDAGAVNVIFGSVRGLSSAVNQLFSQDTPGVVGESEPFDQFGYSLAAGDFNGDGDDDVAVGAPGEDVGSLDSGGAVTVLYGAATGLSTAADDLWHQGEPGVEGDPEPKDRFGTALVAGHFNDGARADLAIGVPWESIAGEAEIGAVNVLYGSVSGLTATGDQFWHQGQPGVEGDTEVRDWFGETLGAGDFDADRRSDLAVGVPGESIGGVTDVGAVNVLYGAAAGLNTAGDQLWHQGVGGVVGDPEPFDRISGRLRSDGEYRIAYLDGADVRVSGDRMTHSPQERIDMSGRNGTEYFIVAARAGTIEIIVDSNEEPTNNNNYVWVSHSGGEWTKYTHFEKDSVTDAGRFEGEDVSSGTLLGIEGDVGRASGKHLHFEVAVPYDPADPVDDAGFVIGENLDPRVCGIPGNTFVSGQTYVAGGC